MKRVINQTRKPLSVPLPRGKILHLGPARSGQVSSEAAEHPSLRKLVEAGTLAVVDEGATSSGAATGRRKGPPSFHGHAVGGGGRRSGDR